MEISKRYEVNIMQNIIPWMHIFDARLFVSTTTFSKHLSAVQFWKVTHL